VPGDRTEPRYLAVGRITRPWGVRGELKAEILTEDPTRFEGLETVYVGPQCVPYCLERARLHRGAVLLKLARCDDRNAAEALRGLLVQVAIEDTLPLEEGEYWLYQILGLEVWTTEDELLGVVREILETRANDVYVVQDRGGRQVLVPALDSVVLDIDLEAGRMLVALPEGLV
jgi:16S rRNA processing protein RimM